MLEIVQVHRVNLESHLRRVKKWKVHLSTLQDVRRFIEQAAVGKVNKGRRISDRRLCKYLDMLKLPLEFLNKPIPRINERDIERFEKALAGDQIISQSKGMPYAHATKTDFRKGLKIFLKWRLGAAAAIPLVGWLDTRDKPKTPQFLSEQEVEQLYRECRTAEQRFVVAMLFDSGARAQEFLNIRYEDIYLPEGKDNFVKLALKEEYSKTKGRTISLYWRYSLDAVQEYLRERIAAGIKASDPIFIGSYNGMRMFLHRLGQRVLQRSVHPHLFRHSSATYYANKLNRQELCYRYGWKFSSNMPDIYISRAGMETKDLDQKFTHTELSQLKDDLTAVRQETRIKDETIQKMSQTIEQLQTNLESINRILAHHPTVQDVEAAIQRKRRSATSPTSPPPTDS